MVIAMKANASEKQLNYVINKLTNLGLKTHVSIGTDKTVLGVIGNVEVLKDIALETIDGVDFAVPISCPYKLASREFKRNDTVLTIKGKKIGGAKLAVIAGPCSVEDYETLDSVAESIKKSGAEFLRGGAFKPRTSPYTFQGLGKEGLKILSDVGKKHNLIVVTELMEIRHVDDVCQYSDIIQIGSRNMHNTSLLFEVGRTNKPVLLKRGLSATIKEFLLAAEYIMSQGNYNIVLCERGIRTFEDYTRNTLDLSAVPAIKRLSHLPIIIDPSHGVGRWGMVKAMSKAAVAAGADGLMIEVHPKPENALSDGDQSLMPDKFQELMDEVSIVAKAVKREI